MAVPEGDGAAGVVQHDILPIEPAVGTVVPVPAAVERGLVLILPCGQVRGKPPDAVHRVRDHLRLRAGRIPLRAAAHCLVQRPGHRDRIGLRGLAHLQNLCGDGGPTGGYGHGPILPKSWAPFPCAGPPIIMGFPATAGGGWRDDRCSRFGCPLPVPPGELGLDGVWGARRLTERRCYATSRITCC